jgi:CheY-like chemotaxis protein
MYSAFQHALASDRVQGIESTCRTSSGTLVPILISLAVMKDDEGRPQAVICAAQNISNLKKIQQALQQKLSEIEAINRNMEELVASRTAELAVGNESLRAEVAERQKKTEELRAARDAAESANRAKSEFLANMSHGSVRDAAALDGTEGFSRVLLVDDSQENRTLMKLLLARQPLTIEEANNGSEALQLFEQNEYALVLMDIQMPIMDGYTATRMMRRIEERSGRSRTPVVALTAHAYEADIRRCREAGCDGHIAKPFKKKGLLQCLAGYLQGIEHG